MRRSDFTVLACLLLLLTFARPAPTGAESPHQETPRPVIIDTDMAMDDWIAILYLLQRPDIDVKALTVTGTGEAHCDAGVQNAQHLLALGGQPAIPVACGRETPLVGDHVFPADWRSAMDMMMGLPLPANPTPLLEITAIDLIASVLQETPQPVTFVTLGPLTNIGDLIQAQPDVLGNIRMMYIMGGALNVPGNLLGLVENETAEWNIYIDPHAAQLTIESGVPVTLVPLDVTNTVPLTWDFYGLLQHDRTTPSADFVFEALSKYRWALRNGGYYFWDPLAAATATDESLAEIEQQTIRVIEDEGPESGRTIADPAGSPVFVATSADAERFTTALINVLNGRAVDTPLPDITISAEELDANKEAVIRWYEQVWGKNDPLAAEALITRDYVGHINADELPAFAIVDTIRQLHVGLPDLTVSVEIAAAEGDRVAAMVVLHGTHTGSDPETIFAGEPTGNEIILRFNTVLYLVDGHIVEEWITVDMLGFLTQIGALPAPP